MCINRATRRRRAMEIVRREDIKEEYKREIINELDLLKSLNHPNIRRVYEVFCDLNKIYIVTELCTGGELFDVI